MANYFFTQILKLKLEWGYSRHKLVAFDSSTSIKAISIINGKSNYNVKKSPKIRSQFQCPFQGVWEMLLFFFTGFCLLSSVLPPKFKIQFQTLNSVLVFQH